MSLVYGDKRDVLENRRDFLGPLGIDFKLLVCANQVHGSRVVHIGPNDAGKGALSAETAIEGADALITDQKNIPLAVFTADCLSVFLFDPVKQAIGIVHAGWKGTKERICAKAVNSMKESFRCDPGDVLAGFGPLLDKCCYEVTGEFKAHFDRGVIQRDGRLYFDLNTVNKEQLLGEGLKLSNISYSSDCTSCKNSKYFSFRKEGKLAGRQMSVIMLR